MKTQCAKKKKRKKDPEFQFSPRAIGGKKEEKEGLHEGVTGIFVNLAIEYRR